RTVTPPVLAVTDSTVGAFAVVVRSRASKPAEDGTAAAKPNTKSAANATVFRAQIVLTRRHAAAPGAATAPQLRRLANRFPPGSFSQAYWGFRPRAIGSRPDFAVALRSEPGKDGREPRQRRLGRCGAGVDEAAAGGEPPQLRTCQAHEQRCDGHERGLGR